jgi:hypothetical protein
MNRIHAAIACALLTISASGCGSDRPAPPTSVNVKGTVYLDSKRVATAEIHFSVEGVPPRVMPVKDGTFAGDAPAGKNKVEVYIYVDGPPSEKYPGTVTKINVSPERYWGASTVLGANVEEGGANEFKFDLTSE